MGLELRHRWRQCECSASLIASLSIDFVIEQTTHSLAVSTSVPALEISGPVPTFDAVAATSTSQVDAGVSVSVQLRPLCLLVLIDFVIEQTAHSLAVSTSEGRRFGYQCKRSSSNIRCWASNFDIAT